MVLKIAGYAGIITNNAGIRDCGLRTEGNPLPPPLKMESLPDQKINFF